MTNRTEVGGVLHRTGPLSRLYVFSLQNQPQLHTSVEIFYTPLPPARTWLWTETRAFITKLPSESLIPLLKISQEPFRL